MRIMIVGSMTFARQMLDTKKELEELGHYVSVPCDVDLHAEQSGLIDNLSEDLKHLVENNILRKCFKLIEESDAILILNHKKNDIDGYIGTSSLMESGLAYYLGKKIFILNNIPDSNDHRWAHEIESMQPIIINRDFSKIK